MARREVAVGGGVGLEQHPWLCAPGAAQPDHDTFAGGVPGDYGVRVGGGFGSV